MKKKILLLALVAWALAACHKDEPEPEVTAVKIASRIDRIRLGETHRLTYEYTDAKAAPGTVAWTSSDTAVLAVLADGTLRPRRTGRATVKLQMTVAHRDGRTLSLTDELPIEVVRPDLQSLRITAPAGATFHKGDAVQLTLAPTPPEASTEGVAWSSSDSLVAVVTPEGLVRCVRPGKAVITAAVKGANLSATYTLTVAQRPTQSIAFSDPAFSLLIGERQATAVVFTPAGADDRRLVYTSSDTTVATISPEGVVTAHRRGVATLTARTVSGGLKATCQVTVQHFTDRICVMFSGTWIYMGDNRVTAQARMTLRNSSDRDIYVERFIVESDGREIHRQEVGRTLRSGDKLACEVDFKEVHDPQFKYHFTVGSERYEAHYHPHMIGAKALPERTPLPFVILKRGTAR